jgi:hypothetical protein
MGTLEEIQARRDARRLASQHARTEQFARDLQRLDELEEEHGYERVMRVDLPGWDPAIGGPTLVIVRCPKASEAVIKRFEQEVHRSKEGSDARLRASESLGRACLVYPDPVADPESFTKVLDTAPGLLSQAALLVIRRAQGQAAEEGKG